MQRSTAGKCSWGLYHPEAVSTTFDKEPIVPRVDSLFCQKGKIDSARENLLLVKTRASLLSEIIGLVEKARSHEVPEIVAMPIVGGGEEYLKWPDNACR